MAQRVFQLQILVAEEDLLDMGIQYQNINRDNDGFSPDGTYFEIERAGKILLVSLLSALGYKVSDAHYKGQAHIGIYTNYPFSKICEMREKYCTVYRNTFHVYSTDRFNSLQKQVDKLKADIYEIDDIISDPEFGPRTKILARESDALIASHQSEK